MLTPCSPPGASYGVLPRPCRALVLLNPQSGAGRALEDFQAVVQPMLADADITPTVFVTGESPRTLLLPSTHLGWATMGLWSPFQGGSGQGG